MNQFEQPLKLLAVGAHPDDLEFGMGGVLLKEFSLGAEISIVITSRGEAGSAGTPDIREAEARAAAELVGASNRLHFLDFGGDGLQVASPENTVQIAHLIRKIRPDVVCAPTLTENQHPDHFAVGTVVRNACRLARYGGLKALTELSPHRIASLWYYSITGHESTSLSSASLIDISDSVEAWKQMMCCHESQVSNRNYIDLQLARAQQLGAMAQCEYAMALWPNDPLVISSLSDFKQTARAY